MSDKNTAELLKRIAELEAQVKSKNTLKLKVSDKGGVSVYGLNNRFPVTLYKQQWERLLDFSDNIRKFMKDHDKELTTKEDSK